MAKSKFFRVAVEGATATDGRTISAQEINEMAAGFNRETYGVRINMEHLRGFSPQPPFNAYGDVLALEARDIDLTIDGKVQKRRALYAQIDPTPALVELNRARQKIYTSVEIAPNFATTGKAGLVGIAVTDSPASLGTEILAFSAKTDDAVAKAIAADFNRRKTNPANHFSAALETTFEVEGTAEPSLKDSIASFFRDMLKPEATTAAAAAAVSAAPLAPADPTAAFSAALEKLGEKLDVRLQAFSTKLDGLRTDHDVLKAQLDGTPKHTSRPASSGGSGAELTDC